MDKIAQRLISNSTRWCRTMKAKKFGGTLFQYNLYTNKLPTSFRIQTNIDINWKLLKKGVRYVIEDGDNIIFWEDKQVGLNLMNQTLYSTMRNIYIKKTLVKG